MKAVLVNTTSKHRYCKRESSEHGEIKRLRTGITYKKFVILVRFSPYHSPLNPERKQQMNSRYSPMQLCTRTDSCVRKRIVDFRLKKKNKLSWVKIFATSRVHESPRTRPGRPPIIHSCPTQAQVGIARRCHTEVTCQGNRPTRLLVPPKCFPSPDRYRFVGFVRRRRLTEMEWKYRWGDEWKRRKAVARNVNNRPVTPDLSK